MKKEGDNRPLAAAAAAAAAGLGGEPRGGAYSAVLLYEGSGKHNSDQAGQDVAINSPVGGRNSGGNETGRQRAVRVRACGGWAGWCVQ